MAEIRNFNLGGLNLYVNPLLRSDGEFIQLTNVESYPYGAKSKRSGYNTLLGTANGSAVTNLFSWTKQDGSLFLYAAHGNVLNYSVGGTGAWTTPTNGTISAGNYVGHAVLEDTLFICDGAGSTRYTTSGTSFTDGTLAPVAVDLVQYQRRVYALGTSDTLFYSVTNDGTNWATTGTSDSSSLTIPGAGKLKSGFVASDRLLVSKTSGIQFKWDGFSLTDTGTKLGVTSPWSVAEAEGYYFYLNRLGHQGYGGARPQLLSNAIQPQIYNNSGSAIAGGNFDTAPGGVNKFKYYLAVGTTTDDYSNTTIDDNIIVYDYQTNEYLNNTFAHNPNCFHDYKDGNNVTQFAFGGAGGQVYQLSGTATSDSGNAISSTMEFVVHSEAPDRDKHFKQLKLFFNPGCNAKVQIALSDMFLKGDEQKEWTEAIGCNTGVCDYFFKQGENRGKFLYVKIYDSSKDAKYTFYGFTYEAEVVGHA